MKRVLVIILSLVIMLVPSTAMAASGSTSFYLANTNDWQTVSNQYLVVDSVGSITVAATSGSGFNLRVTLWNNSTGGSSSKIISSSNGTSNNSVSWNNLYSGNYQIEIKNFSSHSIGGVVSFTWTGTWGAWIE